MPRLKTARQSKLTYRVGDIYKQQLTELGAAGFKTEEMAIGYDAFPVDDPSQRKTDQATSNEALRTRLQVNRRQAKERLLRMQQAAGGIGRIIIGQQLSSDQYLTLAIPIEAEEPHYLAIADSDIYGNAAYACRTTDIPATFGHSKLYALALGARRFRHTTTGIDNRLEEQLMDFVTDPNIEIIRPQRINKPVELTIAQYDAGGLE